MAVGLAVPCEPVPVCDSSSSEDGPVLHNSSDEGPDQLVPDGRQQTTQASDTTAQQHEPASIPAAAAQVGPAVPCEPVPVCDSSSSEDGPVLHNSSDGGTLDQNPQPSTLNPPLRLAPLVPEFPPGVCCNCYRRKLLKFGQPFPYECHRCSVYEEPRRWFWQPKLVEVPDVPSPAPNSTASPAPPASCAELAPG